MEWTTTDASSLLTIDLEIGKHDFSPGVYEIVRRVIYETADFDYLSQLHICDRALSAGAAALVARTPIIVDVPFIQVGIAYQIQQTFVNPVYYRLDSHPSYALTNLAKRYPEGIYIIGREQTALATFLTLIKQEDIRPAFAILTPPKFLKVNSIEQQLEMLAIPHIRVTGRKGNASVAVAITHALIDLAWEVYSEQ